MSWYIPEQALRLLAEMVATTHADMRDDAGLRMMLPLDLQACRTAALAALVMVSNGEAVVPCEAGLASRPTGPAMAGAPLPATFERSYQSAVEEALRAANAPVATQIAASFIQRHIARMVDEAYPGSLMGPPHQAFMWRSADGLMHVGQYTGLSLTGTLMTHAHRRDGVYLDTAAKAQVFGESLLEMMAGGKAIRRRVGDERLVLAAGVYDPGVHWADPEDFEGWPLGAPLLVRDAVEVELFQSFETDDTMLKVRFRAAPMPPGEVCDDRPKAGGAA